MHTLDRNCDLALGVCAAAATVGIHPGFGATVVPLSVMLKRSWNKLENSRHLARLRTVDLAATHHVPVPAYLRQALTR
jgi:hypothetical protein